MKGGTMETVDDVLAHYGIKGMRWGVRREGKSSGPVSSDAQAAKESKQIIKKSGTAALSNKELQHVITRMNLEQQYSNLNKGNTFTKRLENGNRTAKTLGKTGKTLKEIYKIGAPFLAAMMAAGYVANRATGGYSTNVSRVVKPAGAIAGRTVKAIAVR
jgi:predicted RNA-binding protein Jag